MTRKIALLAVVVFSLPFSAFADGGVSSNVAILMNTMPEPSTLGLLGSGLIGFAFVVRRKLKVTLARQSAAQRLQSSQSPRTVEQNAA
jgi:hypothetical protein